MENRKNIRLVRGYCAQCRSLCPTIAKVEDGIFTRVLSDRDHPNSSGICLKALAGPELVYSPARLKYPMKRTNPKDNPDAGWQRISWDEALDTIATKLTKIKTEFGAESVAFYRPAAGGSPSQDFWDWGQRLAYAFGSPNVLATTHICQWARDSCSAYTYGTGIPTPEFEKSSCILLWGHNPYNTCRSDIRDIELGVKNGARLIVIDPIRTKAAEKADLWLQVRPGTDCALALALLNVIIDEGLYDKEFVTNWTTSSFLIRDDTLDHLKVEDIRVNAGDASYVAWDKTSNSVREYDLISMSFNTKEVTPAITGSYSVQLVDGRKISCKTAFQHLIEIVSQYPPEKVEKITGVPADSIRKAACMFATIKPASYYTCNGIEEQINTAQTNRAICLVYALTGNYDTAGSNRVLNRLPVNQVTGLEFLTPEIRKKRIGSTERPLGPAGELQRGKTTKAIRANDLYSAILTGTPYPMKGLVAFEGNIITANPGSAIAREASSKLEFFVQVELFMTPPARLADIVLPAASYWESWHIRTGFIHSVKGNCHVQLRPAVVPAQYESKSDIEIIFEFARRLGMDDKFWNGDIEKAFNYQISPLGLTVADLRKHPGGMTLNYPSEEKAYSKINVKTGKQVGFNTPGGRVEIYSQLFKDYGFDPLPVYRGSVIQSAFEKKY